jgi:hypothetical protein
LAAVAQRFRLELVPRQTLRLVPSVTIRPRDGIKIFVRERTSSRAANDGQAAAEPIQYAEA